MPALVISGVADEVTPVQSKLLADRLPDARWVLFQHSSHVAILEEQELHWSVVHNFLDEVDTRRGSYCAAAGATSVAPPPCA